MTKRAFPVHQPARDAGFTLMEALVTVAVVAIVLSAGVPAFRNAIERNRMEAAAERLHSSMVYARSQAMSRRATVSVCPANEDVSACGSSWDNGWLVFEDGDSDGLLGTGEEILARDEGSFAGVVWSPTTAFAAGVSYAKNGLFNSVVAGQKFSVCRKSEPTECRVELVFSQIGRVSTEWVNS